MSDENLNEQLNTAVMAREINDVLNLISMGADMHKLNNKLCLKAIQNGFHDVLTLLLDKGANPNSSKLVEQAIKKHDLKSVKILVAAGADIYSKKTNYLISCKTESAVSIWRYLYQEGIDPTPLGWVYFAGIMGPADLLVSKLTVNDNKDYIENVIKYQDLKRRTEDRSTEDTSAVEPDCQT